MNIANAEIQTAGLGFLVPGLRDQSTVKRTTEAKQLSLWPWQYLSVTPRYTIPQTSFLKTETPSDPTIATP